MAAIEREQAVRDGLAAFRLAGIIGEVDVPMRKVYVRGLENLDASIIAAGADRLLHQAGLKFHITLPVWLEACAAVVEARRAEAARKAQSFTKDCPECHGSGWSNAEGPNAVLRCNCHKRALELMASAEAPVARLALPGESWE